MIVIVGGGITGLTLGRELQRQGQDFVILEASSRPGGVIRSAEVEGRILDWGPQRARLTAAMDELVRDVGLQDEVVEAPHGLDLFVYRGDRLRKVPFSAAEFIASDVVSLRGKLRLALEPFTGRARPKERVSEYFTRKIGRELYETLIAPLYGGLYGSDPADMRMDLSLMRVLKEFKVERSLVAKMLRGGGRIQPPPACTFRGGMEMLPRALAAALGDRVLVDRPVRGIRRHGAGWRVQVQDETLQARHVVVTTPAPVASVLLRDAAPDASKAIRSLRYNPLAVVHLLADTDLRGLGFQVAFNEPDRVLRGVTFNDSLFGRENLYTAYLGGAQNPGVADMSDGELHELAAAEFRHCTGYDAQPVSVEHERMPGWDVSWDAIQGLQLPEGLHIAANWWSRPGLPGRLAEARRLAARLHGVSEREVAVA